MTKLLFMETMTIQLTNQKAAGLLHELEELELIKIISEDTAEKGSERLSDKYWGIITPEQAADLHEHINEMRNEWDRGI